jgi:hypothetical protein
MPTTDFTIVTWRTKEFVYASPGYKAKKKNLVISEKKNLGITFTTVPM